MRKIISKELKYVANNYKPMRTVISKGKGIHLYDMEGKKYMDFMAGYSAVNQGHCHPKIVEEMRRQCGELTMCSRAFHNDKLAEYSEYICNLLGYENILPTNGGAEGGETAIKIARAWGYMKKNIPENEAVILFAKNNFWGRTITACGSSSDPTCYENYGPYSKGCEMVEYDNLKETETKFKNNKNICAIMLEPIQGEGGIIIPNEKYLYNMKRLCNKYNVLLIVDEIQTGLGRTGLLLESYRYGIQPDILILGKALSGGLYPISGVLSSKEIMDNIKPGTHGSTYGGNPLASAVAKKAVETIIEEDMINNSEKMGEIFRRELNSLLIVKYNVKKVRGHGLMNAIEFTSKKITDNAINRLFENKILTKSTKENIIRLTPPLIINKLEIEEALEKIKIALKDID
jgi:ornithine--oxo-acid transaminase